MSSLIGIVSKIEKIDNLTLVTFDIESISLQMISLELNSSIEINTQVKLSIKPTSISLIKHTDGLNISSNYIKTTIKSITIGKILSSVILDLNNTLIESIITTNSLNKLNLKKNEKITALINQADISILEIIQ